MIPGVGGLRVLKVCPAFPAGEEEEGRDPWLLELAWRLREAGLGLEVLAPSREGRGGLEEVCGVPVHRYRYAPRQAEILYRRVSEMKVMDGLWRLSLPGGGLIVAGALASGRLLRRRPYDVIHAHWPLPAGLLALAGARAASERPRLVATFHGAELAACGVTGRCRVFWRPSARGSTRRWRTPMTGMAPVVIPFGPSRLAVEGRGTSRGRSALVLAVGRLVERKGFAGLVRASGRLRGRARVVIVGEGEARKELLREVRAGGVGDVVRIAGRVGGPELARLYRESSIFCLPAVVDRRGCTEGLGVAIVEAMFHGLPVVAGRVGGIPDAVVHGETGLLVAPGDHEALACALLMLLENPGLARQMGAAGRRRAERLFSWERVVADHLRLYERAVTGRCAGSRVSRPEP